MPSTWIYYQADGTRGTAARSTHLQAKALAAPDSLFVYGGDVYNSGSQADFGIFDSVFGDVLPLLAETAGNHDWYNLDAQGYEEYWLARQPPASRTPIDTNLVGPDRHHFTQPIGNGWLGVFIDCGPDSSTPLTADALARVDDWLTAHGSRRVLVFLHHGRLSCGQHGDNTSMDSLWQSCFDSHGAPRVAAWIAGHNHNMGTYASRQKGTGPGTDLPLAAGIAAGVAIFLNGAGGAQLYHQGDIGTFPDVFAKDTVFGFLQIELVDQDTAAFQHYSTGGLGADAAAPIGPRTEIHLPS